MIPTVKNSEKSRILVTKDYSLFSTSDMKISIKFLNHIIDSITEKDCSIDYPILVDSNYKILDGVYRFNALRNLGLRIYYKISQVTTEADAARLKHIHRSMSIEKIVKIYSDVPAYNQIIEIAYDFNISYREALLTNGSINVGWNGISKKKLSAGKLMGVDDRIINDKVTAIKRMMMFLDNMDFKNTWASCLHTLTMFRNGKKESLNTSFERWESENSFILKRVSQNRYIFKDHASILSKETIDPDGLDFWANALFIYDSHLGVLDDVKRSNGITSNDYLRFYERAVEFFTALGVKMKPLRKAA